VQPFLEGNKGMRRGGSTMPEADDTTKSGTTVGGGPKAASDVWRSAMTKVNWVSALNY
jgi:hypothetical protein